MPGEPDPAAELYGVDPDAFVDARNRLAKELRAGGRREEAGRVAKLRKPPPTAWALNQVARHRPELIDAVLDAGGELRQAMEDALSGDPSGVRGAQAAERRAVDAAVAAAATSLEAAGRTATDAVKLRVAASLRAAVVDPSVADLVRAGVLDADRDAPGFGLDGLSVGAAPAAARRSRPPKERPAPPPAEPPEEKDPVAQRRRLAAEADHAEDLARRLEREAAEAERRAAHLAAASADAAAEAARTAQRAAELEAGARAAAEAAASARTEADAADARARLARRRAEDG